MQTMQMVQGVFQGVVVCAFTVGVAQFFQR